MPVNPYVNIKEVWELRRAAARYPEKWFVAGSYITDHNKHIIGNMTDPGMATLVVRSHNMLLSILNKLFTVLAKMGDRRMLDILDGKGKDDG